MGDTTARPDGEAATVASDVKAIEAGETVPAATADATFELPSVEASNYEIREELGAGGMGKVVVARDRRLGRILAVKVAKVASSSVHVRFAREAVLTARLQHPGIVPVYEAGVWPSAEPFYAMKLVAGAPLAKLILKARSLDERLALIPNVIAVVDTLAYAHAHRVIHRDLKPDNVIVGDYGETIVIDWGLAKELGTDDRDAPSPIAEQRAGQTVAGAAMGTPPYMSPEQAAAERVDERADVYSLGALLYHVLAGIAPYWGPSSDAIMAKVLAGPPQALAERQKGIPKDLLAIVDKAMARDPAARYQDAKQLADDLKRFERGQLVAAHVYSRKELLRRWYARHRTAVIAGTIVTVVLGAAVAFFARTELRDRAERARRVAELLSADDAEYGRAMSLRGAGDFPGAAETLAREVQRLSSSDAADVVSRRAERSSERERLEQIASFYVHARSATFLVGDEDRGDEALYELKSALGAMGALDGKGHFVPGSWWDLAFADELSADQRRDVQLQAYRLVMNLAIMHFKLGGLLAGMNLVLPSRNPASATQFLACLEALGQTPGLEQTLGIAPAQIARTWDRMARHFLKKVGAPADIAAAEPFRLTEPPRDANRTDNADDHAFIGVGHVLVAQNADSAEVRGMRFFFPDDFEYDNALEKAQRELRAAIRIDPKLYWPHFMLSQVQHISDDVDLRSAELELDVCVMLAPDLALSYGQRAIVVAQQAQTEQNPIRRLVLFARALDDSQRAVDKERTRPVTYWTRGDLMKLLGQHDDAIEAYTRALELEDDLLGKFNRHILLRTITQYVTADLRSDGVEAQTLLAFMAVVAKDPQTTIEHADRALQRNPAHARALATRGTAYLQLDKPQLALADFDAALKAAPNNELAALGRAQLLEKTASPSQALAAFDALVQIAIVPAHLAQGHRGRSRALAKLGRTQDANAALEAARKIEPWRDDK
jgi:tetratricopeptide (TPR) repeat protein